MSGCSILYRASDFLRLSDFPTPFSFSFLYFFLGSLSFCCALNLFSRFCYFNSFRACFYFLHVSSPFTLLLNYFYFLLQVYVYVCLCVREEGEERERDMCMCSCVCVCERGGRDREREIINETSQNLFPLNLETLSLE